MASTGEERAERRGWRQNPDAVKRDILTVAVEEFAAHGLSGARIHSIAARTRTSKRMIYYYFGDKQGLYVRALEKAYAKVREGESALDLGQLAPRAALARLVAFTFDHHRSHPEFIRMVMIENIHHAENLAGSDVLRRLNLSAIEKLEDICRRGEAEGVFRPGLDPVALHWQISAASFFNVSNRPTFSAIFGDRMFSDDAQATLRDQVVEAILATVATHD
ncbi:DNA-binding transcriptional regulator, AcrR family [Tranquillimonas rosea]|uniref:DNA-binding transcriptional regulator, AcrR family n=1 Tax=Tranquillimonas rosea TaxID=641238 RepID=A0A1H9SR42_9RHOB|nr:TetR family transcriptional regulator [Tranquillimonas rosea]SER87285.1 DNA-binding transcriptional regulator, AcrR family [Tranquillimonas rosea]